MLSDDGDSMVDEGVRHRTRMEHDLLYNINLGDKRK